jgi:DNA uptake protein ComE-like DNA-binding protein
MAGRHWLDPLARRILVAAGQLPPEKPAARQARPGADSGAGDRETLEQEAVEQELLALKLAQNPGLRLRTAQEVRHAAALGWHLDVNRACAGDWLRLPGCRPDQVDLLQRLRSGGVQLSGPDDLAQALQIPPEQVRIWLPVLRFRWYGDPGADAAPVPVAINRATEPQLRERLGLTAERCRRLMRERAREPFRDLADLQQRLQLPPDLVERWIGRVGFEPAPPGPELPPARRPSR